MKIYKEKCLFYPDIPECDNYVLETMEDWDEYEKILKEKSPDFLKCNPNFFSFKEDFKKYIGKIWSNKSYEPDIKKNCPLTNYKIIAMEDSNSVMDWYWIVQNVDDERDTRYILANSHDLEEGLI